VRSIFPKKLECCCNEEVAKITRSNRIDVVAVLRTQYIPGNTWGFSQFNSVELNWQESGVYSFAWQKSTLVFVAKLFLRICWNEEVAKITKSNRIDVVAVLRTQYIPGNTWGFRNLIPWN
jgi:hypothetical protein